MSKNKSSKQKYKFAIVALLLLAFFALFFILANQEQKPDPASEKEIRAIAAKQLKKDPNELTYEDFVKITELSIAKIREDSGFALYSYEITELSDIKLLSKFKNLPCSGNAWPASMRQINPGKNAFVKNPGVHLP